MRFWFRRGKSGRHVDSGLDGGEGEQEWSKEASREAGAEATWAGGGGGSPGQGTRARSGLRSTESTLRFLLCRFSPAET